MYLNVTDFGKNFIYNSIIHIIQIGKVMTPVDKLWVCNTLSNHQKTIQKSILKNTIDNQNGILKNCQVTQGVKRKERNKTE